MLNSVQLCINWRRSLTENSFSREQIVDKERTPERVGIDDDSDVGGGGIISSEEENGGGDPLLQESPSFLPRKQN